MVINRTKILNKNIDIAAKALEHYGYKQNPGVEKFISYNRYLALDAAEKKLNVLDENGNLNSKIKGAKEFNIVSFRNDKEEIIKLLIDKRTDVVTGTGRDIRRVEQGIKYWTERAAVVLDASSQDSITIQACKEIGIDGPSQNDIKNMSRVLYFTQDDKQKDILSFIKKAAEQTDIDKEKLIPDSIIKGFDKNIKDLIYKSSYHVVKEGIEKGKYVGTLSSVNTILSKNAKDEFNAKDEKSTLSGKYIDAARNFSPDLQSKMLVYQNKKGENKIPPKALSNEIFSEKYNGRKAGSMIMEMKNIMPILSKMHQNVAYTDEQKKDLTLFVVDSLYSTEANVKCDTKFLPGELKGHINGAKTITIEKLYDNIINSKNPTVKSFEELIPVLKNYHLEFDNALKEQEIAQNPEAFQMQMAKDILKAQTLVNEENKKVQEKEVEYLQEDNVPVFHPEELKPQMENLLGNIDSSLRNEKSQPSDMEI